MVYMLNFMKRNLIEKRFKKSETDFMKPVSLALPASRKFAYFLETKKYPITALKTPAKEPMIWL